MIPIVNSSAFAKELDRALRIMLINDITKYWEYQEHFDLPRLGTILRQKKFQNVMPVSMWIHHEDGQKSGLWFKMIKSDRSLAEGYQTRSTIMYQNSEIRVQSR